jgi:hypothetical protein
MTPAFPLESDMGNRNNNVVQPHHDDEGVLVVCAPGRSLFLTAELTDVTSSCRLSRQLLTMRKSRRSSCSLPDTCDLDAWTSVFPQWLTGFGDDDLCKSSNRF